MKHIILLLWALGLTLSIQAQDYRHEIRVGHYFPSLFSNDPITGTLPSIHYRYHRSRVSYRLGLRYSPNIQSGNFDGMAGTEAMNKLKMLELGIQFHLRKNDQNHIFRPYLFSDLRILNVQLEKSDWFSPGLYSTLSRQSNSIGILLGPGVSFGYRRLSISYEAGLYLDYSSRTNHEIRYFPIYIDEGIKEQQSLDFYGHWLNLISFDFHF